MNGNQSDANEMAKIFEKLYGSTAAKNFNHSISVGYSQQLTKNLQLALWIGRGQRSASITERYINRFVVGQDAYEILGNPQLKPEVNNQMDLIFTCKKDNAFFQLNGFYSIMENYISGVIRRDIMKYSMKAPGVRQMQNIEKAFKYGFEAQTKIQILPKLKTEMAIAYTFAEDSQTKNPLPEIAPLDFRWKWEANLSPVLLVIKYRFVGAQNRINPDFGELKTPDFSLLDFQLQYRPFSNASFNFEILNVFDRAYAEHLNRTLNTNNQKRIFMPGRSFNLTFSYEF